MIAYPVNTLAEMSAIPPELRDKFFADLPDMVGMLEGTVALVKRHPGMKLVRVDAAWRDGDEPTDRRLFAIHTEEV